MKLPDKQFLSTGEAARLFSVTPDTVLKWIKAGKIVASRTPGGHYRIPCAALSRQLKWNHPTRSLSSNPKPFLFCWEYHNRDGELSEECTHCMVYRCRTKRCYELADFPEIASQVKLYCSTSCEECDYYKLVKEQPLNVLVVSDRTTLQNRLKKEATANNFNISFTDCEYHCSMVIESFRPDFVVLDCRLGRARSREFARNIAMDPRIPYVRVIFSDDQVDFSRECNHEILAFIRQDFSLADLERMIQQLHTQH